MSCLRSLVSSRVQGAQLRQWVNDTGAVEGDLIAFRRRGTDVLVRRIPAADADAPPAGGGAAAAASKQRQQSPEPEAGGAGEQLQGRQLVGRRLLGAPLHVLGACACRHLGRRHAA